jgi:hypothetical protein
MQNEQELRDRMEAARQHAILQARIKRLRDLIIRQDKDNGLGSRPECIRQELEQAWGSIIQPGDMTD